MSISGGRGDDRASVCQNQQIKDGSPGGSPSQTGSPVRNGSPSQKGSPIRTSTGAEMSIPGGRGDDRASVCQNQQIKDGSPGGSPSQTGSPSKTITPSQTITPSKTGSPSQKRFRNQRISSSRRHDASKRASPIPKPPPLLDSITRRRRLEEYTRGEIFERNVFSSTLNFAMIPHS